MRARSILVIIVSFLIAACGSEQPQNSPEQGLRRASSELDRLHHQRLDMAVDSVEWTLESLQDSGYQEWIPSTTVPKLVRTLNAANITMPGEPEPPGPIITFIADSVSDTWQVVLIPDDESSTIKLLGYDDDPNAPFVEKTITVSRY